MWELVTAAWDFAGALTPERAVGLVGAAGMGGWLAWRAARLACKATWHAGAFARRCLTPAPAAPVILADEVQLLADAIRDSGDRRELGYVVCGPVVVTPEGAVWIAKALAGNKVEGRDVTGHYSADELRAIRAAADDRRRHFAARDREQARHEAIGMPAPLTDVFPTLGTNSLPVMKARRA